MFPLLFWIVNTCNFQETNNMGLTRPKASQINFDLTNISDPVIRLNSDKTGANDTDVGFIFERGSTGDNAVFVWDESAGSFVVGTTTATGTSTGNLTITTGTLVANLEGNVTGNADTATTATNVTATANNATDETVYVTFVDAQTGSQEIETDVGLYYNPSTNTLTTSVFDGTSTSAQYADLAELYVSDVQYEPGTVLIFGGEHEVTLSKSPKSNKVAGVVSTAPGILMNKDCVGDYVVVLALAGRVPCKVKGKVTKGSMMVTSNIEGVAVANNNPAIGTVIGKALEEYNSDEVGVIEVVVGRL